MVSVATILPFKYLLEKSNEIFKIIILGFRLIAMVLFMINYCYVFEKNILSFMEIIYAVDKESKGLLSCSILSMILIGRLQC